MRVKYISKFCILIGLLLMSLDYMVGVDKINRIEQMICNQIKKFSPPKLRVLTDLWIFLIYTAITFTHTLPYLHKNRVIFSRVFIQHIEQIPILASLLANIYVTIIIILYLTVEPFKRNELLSLFCLLLWPFIVWSIIKLLSITVKALARLLSFGPKGILGTIGFILSLLGTIVDLLIP